MNDGMTINDFYKLLYMKYNSQKYNIIYDPCYFNESKLYIPNTIFNEKSRFNVVPLCIFKKHRSYFHYNILILDNYEKTIERFGNHISSGKIVPIYKPLQEVNREELSDIQQVVNLATLTDSTSGDLQLLDNISMFHIFWNLLYIYLFYL